MKKIKKKTTYYYLFLKHRGEFKKRLRWKSIYFYDRQGKPIKQLFFMVRGRKKLTLFDTKIFKYDALGQLVAEEFYASKGWLKERGVYKYNPISSTKQIKWERYDYWGRVIFRNRYSICYDKSGRIIWKRWTRQGTYAISLYEYDRKNRLIKEKFKTRRKRDCYIREYRYQGSRIIEKRDDLITSKESYIDADGQKVEVTKKLGEGNPIIRLKYQYKEKQATFEIEKEFYRNGSVQKVFLRRYNKYGHIVYDQCISYRCNCTGVEECPSRLFIYEYKYYR